MGKAALPVIRAGIAYGTSGFTILLCTDSLLGHRLSMSISFSLRCPMPGTPCPPSVVCIGFVQTALGVWDFTFLPGTSFASVPYTFSLRPVGLSHCRMCSHVSLPGLPCIAFMQVRIHHFFGRPSLPVSLFRRLTRESVALGRGPNSVLTPCSWAVVWLWCLRRVSVALGHAPMLNTPRFLSRRGLCLLSWHSPLLF